jgi:hypothetical protein
VGGRAAGRVNFLPYDWLVKEYEHAVEVSKKGMNL